MTNKKLFYANILKKIRLKKGLTQEKLSELSHINIITISKMENGKCNYDFDKLETLSDIYEVDLIEKYFNFFYEDNNSIDSIIDSLNSKDRINGSAFYEEIDKLNKIREKTKRKVIKKKAEKLILFLKSIEEKNSEKSRNLILEALNLNANFDLENLDNNYYEEIDYRLLMNYGQTFKNPKDRLRIYQFIEKSNFSSNHLRALLYHNIATNFYILNKNNRALKFINKAIHQKSHYSPSPVMLYTKALILEEMNLPYKKYIKKSLDIAKIQGDEIFNTILNHRNNRSNK